VVLECLAAVAENNPSHESPRPVAGNAAPPGPGLSRALGLFDTTMVVMGGIIGAGIFINPYVVAREVHRPAEILTAWALGGMVALAGAFVYAELAARLPEVGGQYAYLREAYKPGVAFLYGWALLLVVQTGGMAAVAVTFARYARELVPMGLSDAALAALALGVLTLINCLGVRAGSTVQSGLMVLKILAIAALVGCGWLLTRHAAPAAAPAPIPPLAAVAAFAAAMAPVMFSYGGYQTANFIAAEVKRPEVTLPRGLVLGVLGVMALYLSVNFVALRALGAAGLAAATAPASAVMRMALGSRGAEIIAFGIAISALGFLSQAMLTAPRVYYAMARDGVFFRAVGWLDPRSRVPVVAIVLQGVWAAVIAVSGRYEQILNYMISIDLLFMGLTATCLFRQRFRRGRETARFRVPGHPWTTLGYIVASWLVVAGTVAYDPVHAGIGFAIVFAGVPAYWLWRRRPLPTEEG
jgi:APA family basic amino acid/polyamine antiporter